MLEAEAARTRDAREKTAPRRPRPPPVRPTPDNEATVIAHVRDVIDASGRSAEEWDAHPTQNLTGDEMENMDRMTRVAAPPESIPEPEVTHEPPVAHLAEPSAPRELGRMRGPATTVHDPEIQTSQAIRVVVWRDATGVHIAPAGTVVSSITIDAVLVALEPTADLTAWLSQQR
jgi:hypothetical protein